MQNRKCYIFTPANEKERRQAEGLGQVLANGTVEIFTADDSGHFARFRQRMTGTFREIPVRGEGS